LQAAALHLAGQRPARHISQPIGIFGQSKEFSVVHRVVVVGKPLQFVGTICVHGQQYIGSEAEYAVAQAASPGKYRNEQAKKGFPFCVLYRNRRGRYNL
jgi:hypothetical protein